jgi:methionyl-tRNA formyltransferase
LTSRKLKVVFMGSPQFAVPSLEALIGCDALEVILVVTQPDRAKGRGKRVTPTAVRETADRLGLPVVVMTRENYADRVDYIRSLRPDVVVVVAFGMILRGDLLELPPLGCINLHASLLPKYRGVTPIQAAILAGDTVTGNTTILMDKGVDTGDILLSELMEIRPDDTALSLGQRLSEAGAGLVVRTVLGLRDGRLSPVKQGPAVGGYTRKICKDDGLIDWSRPAQDIERFVRAMSSWPSAYTFSQGKRLIVVQACLGPSQGIEAPPGTVLSLRPCRVACGRGSLDVRLLKPEGRRTVMADCYACSGQLNIGDCLGDSSDKG